MNTAPTESLPRECEYTFAGDDDGLQWFDCNTHGFQNIGNEMPCEGWLNELHGEDGKSS